MENLTLKAIMADWDTYKLHFWGLPVWQILVGAEIAEKDILTLPA